MKRVIQRIDTTLWTRNLVILVVATFFVNFGQGLFRGVNTNYYVDTLAACRRENRDRLSVDQRSS